MMLLGTGHIIKLTSPPDAGSNDDAMNSSISHNRVGRPRLWVAWVVLFSGAADGALEGVPINVLPPEEDTGEGGGRCERVARVEVPFEFKDLVGAGELFSDEGVGDGGGACSLVESLDGCRGVVDLLVLFSEGDAGVGGGARGPIARCKARVER